MGHRIRAMMAGCDRLLTGIEAFCGLFRRAVNGVWHHISREHANR